MAAPRQRRRDGGISLLGLPALVLLAATAAATLYVAYVLWPRWPGAPVTLDAPTLPITIGGEAFNIEPAAIRQDIQRKPGTQTRVDLTYRWPSLTPPDPTQRPSVQNPVNPNERLFVTIEVTDGALPPLERAKTIYPRYLAEAATTGPDGVAVRAFRDGTPYQGEDFVYDPDAPEHFAARCTRSGVGNSGMCLYDRRVGSADVTVRFPRDWLADWQTVAHNIDRLLARLHPPAR
ncbi:MAG: hypothetical protein AB7T86_11500 [Xanthobacteraceae bacterium]|uniref:hypothetical protein n=1 Tax=Pseudolabrys sp. TaxID=1960880 RepID=UPI003D134CC6